MAGEVGVSLPDGWVLNGGDVVVISDETWTRVTEDDETLGRLLDLGYTSEVADPVPTWRDIQQTVVNAGPGGTYLQSEIDTLNSELGAHEAATTSVHGIADTSLLETKAGAQAKADSAQATAEAYTDVHAAKTTAVHGIVDTSKLAWNQNVDVSAATDGQVLTRVGGVWEGRELTMVAYEATINFATPSDTWLIAHNQNTYSIVIETFDNNDTKVEGAVSYPDANHVQVQFYYPQTGYARLWGP